MGQLFTDGARTELVTAISAADKTLVVLDGTKFPVANTGTAAVGPATDWFKVVLQDAAGFEIVYVRTRAGGSNSFTNVLRGQDGTTAKAYLEGTVVGLRPTAGDLTAITNKLNGIAVNATANASDAQLRARSTHTGTQLANTISNVVGAVSQTGGVPTGAIIQRGSNANGEFVRFADGTQICFVAPFTGYVSGENIKTLPAIFVASEVYPFCSIIPYEGMDANARVFPYSTGQIKFSGGFTSTGNRVFIAVFGRWF